MLTIVDDEVGRHDFLFAPCSTAMFERQYDIREPHPNCLDNLSGALAEYGITPDQIGIPFNAFMNVQHHPDGRLEVLPPTSQAGDALTLRAEMDLVIAVSACAASRWVAGSSGRTRVMICATRTCSASLKPSRCCS